MSINTKKWFGRTLMLVLACFMFLGLKDSVAAKADDPASIEIIYANNLDGEGNPIADYDENGYLLPGSTEYSFSSGNGFTIPYAIYITPASGSAITLDPDTFPVDVDFGSIRIWNNNCQVKIAPSRDIDMLRLVQTGPDSWLESSWNRYNRGGCTANEYNGGDTATEIADYFNTFSHDYWNDLTVTFSHDPGDVDNTTIYNISGDISANHLIIENKVGVVLQDGLDDQGHPTEGIISVYNTITVGTDSYIDSIDNKPRLMISEDCTTVTGMYLYDYLGSTGEAPLISGNLGGLYLITNAEIEGNNIRIWTKYHATIPTDAIGNADVTDTVKKYIFAYAPLDFDCNDRVDDDDIRYALAAELANKFRGGPGAFGLSHIDYGSLRMEDVWDSLAGNTTTSDAAILRDRITLMPAGSKTVINADGNEEVRDRYIATIDWGYTESGALISGTVYVYKLNLPEELLICTNFNESTGDGSPFYVRKGFADKRVLIGNATDPDAWQNIHEDYFAAVITVDSFTNVVAGGHGVSMYVKNKDRNLFTFQTISYCKMKFKEPGNPNPIVEPDLFVKIFKRGGLLFATKSEGEAKRYDFVSHDATGNSADKFWEAGGQYPVKLFIHDNILHIMPLNANSGVAKALDKVILTDSTPATAVTINNNNKSDIVITFNSNFYDTVSFELVYADGSKGAFKVEREGIIIQYTGLGDNNNGPEDKDWGRYWLDIYGEGNGNELNYTYDYEEEDFVVMATYYHSSAETGNRNLSLIVTYDDGSTEVISSVDTAHNFSGYKSGAGYTDDKGKLAVDTTTFIVGFSKIDWINRNFTFSKNGHTGGFSVQVVNAGFDNADSFGGAMAGSGKGKYWDGDFSAMYP